MGRGGMFGLIQSLTGRVLPGSRPAVAEGNLLRKGPVIFLIPQTVIEQARAHSRGCGKICLDRIWGVFLYRISHLSSEILCVVQ